MNCSFSLLSYSLYLHSVAFIHNLPIHSCVDSSFFLFSLKYHNDNMVSLCCGLNFLPSIANSPSAVLHASFSKLTNVCINCSPSLCSTFCMIEIFFSSFRSYVLLCSMFVTFIPKLNCSTHFSGAFKSNDVS